MKTKQQWTEETTANLIEMYKNRPCLWNLNDANYTNKVVKIEAYEEILNEIKEAVPGTDITSLKNKIQNLRTLFRKELKKVEKSIRSGKGEDSIYQPKLWYYNRMLFVKDQDSNRPADSNKPPESSNTRSNDPIDIPSSEDSDHEGEGLQDDKTTEQEDRTTEKEDEVLAPSAKRATKKEQESLTQTRQQRSGHTKRKIDVENPTDFVKTSTDTSTLTSVPRKTDDSSIVGMYVAQKLRKMNESQQILAESLIHQVLTKGLQNGLTDNTTFHDIGPCPLPFHGHTQPLTHQHHRPLSISYTYSLDK